MKTFTMMCGFLMAGWNALPGKTLTVSSALAMPVKQQQDTVNVTVRLHMKAEEHWFFSVAECSVNGWEKAFAEKTDSDGDVILKMKGMYESKPLQLEIKAIMADLEFGNREVTAYVSRQLPEGLQRDTVIEADLNALIPTTVIAATEGLSDARLLLKKTDTGQFLIMPFASEQMYLLLEKGSYDCCLDARTEEGHIVRSRWQRIEVGDRPVTAELKARAADFHPVSFVTAGLPDRYQSPFYVVDDFTPDESGYWLENGRYEVTANLSDVNPLLLTLTRKVAFEAGDSDQEVLLNYSEYADLPIELLVDEEKKLEGLTLRVTDGMETDSVTGYSVLQGELRTFLPKGKPYIWEVLSSEGKVLKRMEQSITDDLEVITLDLRRGGSTVGFSSNQEVDHILTVSRSEAGLQVMAPEAGKLVHVDIFTTEAVRLLQADLLPGKLLPVYLRRPGIYLVRLQQGTLTRTVKICW